LSFFTLKVFTLAGHVMVNSNLLLTDVKQGFEGVRLDFLLSERIEKYLV
jgi:hypothetical protein